MSSGRNIFVGIGSLCEGFLQQEAHKEYLQGGTTAASLDQRIQSYSGILSHANQHTLSQAVKNAYWVRSGIDSLKF